MAANSCWCSSTSWSTWSPTASAAVSDSSLASSVARDRSSGVRGLRAPRPRDRLLRPFELLHHLTPISQGEIVELSHPSPSPDGANHEDDNRAEDRGDVFVKLSHQV